MDTLMTTTTTPDGKKAIYEQRTLAGSKRRLHRDHYYDEDLPPKKSQSGVEHPSGHACEICASITERELAKKKEHILEHRLCAAWNCGRHRRKGSLCSHSKPVEKVAGTKHRIDDGDTNASPPAKKQHFDREAKVTRKAGKHTSLLKNFFDSWQHQPPSAGSPITPPSTLLDASLGSQHLPSWFRPLGSQAHQSAPVAAALKAADALPTTSSPAKPSSPSQQHPSSQEQETTVLELVVEHSEALPASSSPVESSSPSKHALSSQEREFIITPAADADARVRQGTPASADSEKAGIGSSASSSPLSSLPSSSPAPTDLSFDTAITTPSDIGADAAKESPSPAPGPSTAAKPEATRETPRKSQKRKAEDVDAAPEAKRTRMRRGLSRFKNACFSNSALQLLSQILEPGDVSEYIRGLCLADKKWFSTSTSVETIRRDIRELNTDSGITPEEKALALFAETLHEMNGMPLDQPVNPYAFQLQNAVYRSFCEGFRVSDWDGTKQQDITEHIGHILDMLESCGSTWPSRARIQTDQHFTCSRCKHKHTVHGSSGGEWLYQVDLEQHITRKGQSKAMKEVDPNWEFDFLALMDEASNDEVIEQYQCPKCCTCGKVHPKRRDPRNPAKMIEDRCHKCKTDRVDAGHGNRIARYPEIFMVKINRKYLRWLDSDEYKDETHVEIPFGNFTFPSNESQSVYRAVAISKHLGDGTSGHYMTYRRDIDGDQWVKYDDVRAQPVSDAHVKSSNSLQASLIAFVKIVP